MNPDRELDEAIAFAAADWLRFLAEEPIPTNLHLRDRVVFFASGFRKRLLTEFPALLAATEQVLLLIIARGIEASKSDPRNRIERALGIILPP